MSNSQLRLIQMCRFDYSRHYCLHTGSNHKHICLRLADNQHCSRSLNCQDPSSCTAESSFHSKYCNYWSECSLCRHRSNYSLRCMCSDTLRDYHKHSFGCIRHSTACNYSQPCKSYCPSLNCSQSCKDNVMRLGRHTHISGRMHR